VIYTGVIYHIILKMSSLKIPKINIYPSNLGFGLIKRNLWNKEWKKFKISVKKFNDFFLNMKNRL